MRIKTYLQYHSSEYNSIWHRGMITKHTTIEEAAAYRNRFLTQMCKNLSFRTSNKQINQRSYKGRKKMI